MSAGTTNTRTTSTSEFYAAAAPRSSFEPDAPDEFYLPDFCGARMVFAIVLFGELVAMSLALARAPESASFLTELARISVFVQWLGLTACALLCFARSRLKGLSVPLATGAVFVILIANTALLSGIGVWLGAYLEPGAALFAEDFWPFALRNAAICAIVAAMLLRYFFVSHQWRRHVRAEARSRIHALQARIRPHFLFNSMNTIASLTRSDPAGAEEAVEDLAELFRATLRDTDAPLTLEQEIELTKIYQRIEMLRLGHRLEVRWNLDHLPMRALIPGLTIQPLVENAIYHGIERCDEGGVVEIAGRLEGRTVVITVTNPLPADEPTAYSASSSPTGSAAEPPAQPPADPGLGRAGNHIALDNIRQRLDLAYGARGALEVCESAAEYRVTMRFPLQQ